MTPRKLRASSAAAVLAALWLACGAPQPVDTAASPPFALSETEQRAGWRPLFAGRDLIHWRGFRSQQVPEGWDVASGAITCAGRIGAPDLITRETFGDFELVLEFRTVSADHNSGILYRVTEGRGQTYHTGPEFQILDAADEPRQRTGANYALHPPDHDVARASGEWNEARIVVRGARVEHWLNGTRIVSYELWSDDWKRRVADSKFSRMPDYGLAHSGHIALQSHGDPVWFRNVRIRGLAP